MLTLQLPSLIEGHKNSHKHCVSGEAARASNSFQNKSDFARISQTPAFISESKHRRHLSRLSAEGSAINCLAFSPM